MKYALVAAIAVLVAGPALAQSQSGSMSGTSPSASAGVGVMTKSQAKSDIEGAGYSDVSGLKKNSNGGWSAKATKAGNSHDVMVGTDGKVTED